MRRARPSCSFAPHAKEPHMRNNQPVTGTEEIMRDGASIVSKTGLKGLITYCNPYFVEISGFDEADLLGAPQNIIRPPRYAGGSICRYVENHQIRLTVERPGEKPNQDG